MIYVFLAVLGFAFASGLYDWPWLPPAIAYVVFWIVHLKLMSDEEFHFYKSIPGVHAGRFIGRGLWVALAWVAGAVLQAYGFVPA